MIIAWPDDNDPGELVRATSAAIWANTATPTHERPLTDDDWARIDRAESAAEDAADYRRHGSLSRHDEQVCERRYEAWLDRIGVA